MSESGKSMTEARLAEIMAVKQRAQDEVNHWPGQSIDHREIIEAFNRLAWTCVPDLIAEVRRLRSLHQLHCGLEECPEYEDMQK